MDLYLSQGQTTSSRIRTRATDSISYENNYYTNAAFKQPIII